MRRTISILAACAALLGVSAQAAGAAEILNQTVNRCQADARWQIGNDTLGNFFADVTYDSGTATGTGCKYFQAIVEDDGDFSVVNRDSSNAGSARYSLANVNVLNETVIAGIATGTRESGPFAAANGLLEATLTYHGAGWDYKFVHHAKGPCGFRCYETRVTWVIGPG